MFVSSIFFATFDNLNTPPNVFNTSVLCCTNVFLIDVAKPDAVTVAKLGLNLKNTSKSM